MMRGLLAGSSWALSQPAQGSTHPRHHPRFTGFQLRRKLAAGRPPYAPAALLLHTAAPLPPHCSSVPSALSLRPARRQAPRERAACPPGHGAEAGPPPVHRDTRRAGRASAAPAEETSGRSGLPVSTEQCPSPPPFPGLPQLSRSRDFAGLHGAAGPKAYAACPHRKRGGERDPHDSTGCHGDNLARIPRRLPPSRRCAAGKPTR